jgi:hypothetical protein
MLISITDFSFKIRRAMAQFVAGWWPWRVPWLACLVLTYIMMNIHRYSIADLAAYSIFQDILYRGGFCRPHILYNGYK